MKFREIRNKGCIALLLVTALLAGPELAVAGSAARAGAPEAPSALPVAPVPMNSAQEPQGLEALRLQEPEIHKTWRQDCRGSAVTPQMDRAGTCGTRRSGLRRLYHRASDRPRGGRGRSPDAAVRGLAQHLCGHSTRAVGVGLRGAADAAQREPHPAEILVDAANRGHGHVPFLGRAQSWRSGAAIAFLFILHGWFRPSGLDPAQNARARVWRPVRSSQRAKIHPTLPVGP